MNIFYLDPDPVLAAQYHCDKHLSKMIIETAQMLSAAHHETGSPLSDQVYKLTHKNHPSTIWTRSSTDHYSWLYELFRELNNEFSYRRGKIHASWKKLSHLLCNNPSGLSCDGFEPPPQCMGDEFKGEDTVEAYRRYYHSKDFAKWEWGREKPSWFNNEHARIAQ